MSNMDSKIRELLRTFAEMGKPIGTLDLLASALDEFESEDFQAMEEAVGIDFEEVRNIMRDNTLRFKGVSVHPFTIGFGEEFQIDVAMTSEFSMFMGDMGRAITNVRELTSYNVVTELMKAKYTLAREFVRDVVQGELENWLADGDYISAEDEDEIEDGGADINNLREDIMDRKNFKVRKIEVKNIVGRNAELRMLKIMTSKKYNKNIMLLGKPGIGKEIILDNFAANNGDFVGILDITQMKGHINFDRIGHEINAVANAGQYKYVYLRGLDDLVIAGEARDRTVTALLMDKMSKAYKIQMIFALNDEKVNVPGYSILGIKEISKERIVETVWPDVQEMLNERAITWDEEVLKEFILSMYTGNVDKLLDYVDTLIVTAKEIYGGNLDNRAVKDFTKTIRIPREATEKEAERGNLKGIRERITSRLIGQGEAVEKVVKAIKRSKAGVRLGNRPVGTFLFVGPTGVGKTELVKVLAKELNGTVNSIIRFDMSEFSEGHSVSKLIGSPPGYVGHDDGGQLTKRIKERPDSIVLFDEIEKAHSNVFNMMLQIMDEGRLTDSKGDTVDFTKAIVVMTSNAGYSSEVNGKRSIGFSVKEFDENHMANEQVLTALESTFRPEFLNRIDSVVKFNRLRYDEILTISRIMVGDVLENVEKNGYKVVAKEEVYEHISKAGFSDKYGARNIKRAIQDEVEDFLADCIIEDELEKEKEYTLGVVEGKVQFL